MSDKKQLNEAEITRNLIIKKKPVEESTIGGVRIIKPALKTLFEYQLYQEGADFAARETVNDTLFSLVGILEEKGEKNTARVVENFLTEFIKRTH